MADLTSNESYAADFLELTRAQQLQYLTTLSDAVRSLRRQVTDTQATEQFIDLSTRTFATGWQGNLKADIEGSSVASNGQLVTLKTKAMELYDALDAIG